MIERRVNDGGKSVFRTPLSIYILSGIRTQYEINIRVYYTRVLQIYYLLFCNLFFFSPAIESSIKSRIPIAYTSHATPSHIRVNITMITIIMSCRRKQKLQYYHNDVFIREYVRVTRHSTEENVYVIIYTCNKTTSTHTWCA